MINDKLRMSKALILIINFYQTYISMLIKSILGINRMCRFSPTCSEYTKHKIKQYGVFGILLGIKRIGACR